MRPVSATGMALMSRMKKSTRSSIRRHLGSCGWWRLWRSRLCERVFWVPCRALARRSALGGDRRRRPGHLRGVYGGLGVVCERARRDGGVGQRIGEFEARGEHANLGLDVRPLGGQPFDSCPVVFGCLGACRALCCARREQPAIGEPGRRRAVIDLRGAGVTQA
jgi:hypothetical protein